MLPENEPLEGLEQREVMVLHAAVKDGVRACREALSTWILSSEAGPLEEAINRATVKIMRLSATLGTGTPGPAANVVVRLLLISLLEEMGRQHVINLN